MTDFLDISFNDFDSDFKIIDDFIHEVEFDNNVNFIQNNDLDFKNTSKPVLATLVDPSSAIAVTHAIIPGPEYHKIIAERANRTCSKCSRVFYLRDYMRKHESICGLKERNFICNYPGCGKRLKTKGSLDCHRQIHKDPVSCDICGMEFNQRSGLYQHKKKYHPA